MIREMQEALLALRAAYHNRHKEPEAVLPAVSRFIEAWDRCYPSSS